jgi:hypothetical protein
VTYRSALICAYSLMKIKELTAARNGGSARVLPDYLRHSTWYRRSRGTELYPDGEQGDDRLETAGKLLADLLPQPPGGCTMTDLTLHTPDPDDAG